MKKAFFILIGIVFLLIIGNRVIKKTEYIKVEKNTKEISSIDGYVDHVYDEIKLRWSSMHLVWPGLNYENHNLLLFKLDNNQNVEKAWLINTKEKREVTKEEIEGIEAPMIFGYSEIKFQGKPSILSSIDDSVLEVEDYTYKSLYDLITHELVHFYYQKTYSFEEEGSRSTKYPLDYKPRLYRKMLLLNLCEAFENKEKAKYLSQAKYWLEKWKTEYQSEYKGIESTDIFEGSARYIEYFGAEIRSDIKPEELQKLIQKKLPTETYFGSVDGESYELGFVSGILLDTIYPEWKNKFYDNNITPVDILLSKIKPIEEKSNKIVENKIKELLNENNKEIAIDISNIIKAQEDIRIPYLKIKGSYIHGSNTLNGFYNYKNQEIISNVSCIFKIKNQKLEIKDTSLIVLQEKNEEYMLIPLLESYNIKKNILEINNSKQKGSVAIKKIVEKDGRVLFLVD